MPGPRKKMKHTASGLVPRQAVDEDWRTYRPFWVALQLDPKYHEGFFKQIVYPMRQKSQHKLLLKRNTEASIRTMTQILIRGYGRRVWGAKSHWLVGGPRDGTIQKLSLITGPLKSSPRANVTDSMVADEEEAKKRYHGTLDEGDGSYQVTGKHTTPLDFDSDATIDESETGGDVDNTDARSVKGSGVMPHNHGDGESQKTDLYIEVSEDKERIEGILDELWRRMRDILFESPIDRTSRPSTPGSYIQRPSSTSLDSSNTRRVGSHRLGSRVKSLIDKQKPQDDAEFGWISDNGDGLAGNSDKFASCSESCDEDVPTSTQGPRSKVAHSHEDNRMTSLRTLLANITVSAHEQASRDPTLSFASAPGIPILRALIGALAVDVIDEPVDQAMSTYSTMAEACKYANDEYHGNPVFNPFKWLIENSDPVVRYEAEICRRNINPNNGEAYTWRQIATVLLPYETEKLRSYRISGRRDSSDGYPCDPNGTITDPAACAMATAQMISEGRLPDGNSICAFKFDQYGHICFHPKYVMKVGVPPSAEEIQQSRQYLEQAGYKVIKTDAITDADGIADKDPANGQSTHSSTSATGQGTTQTTEGAVDAKSLPKTGKATDMRDTSNVEHDISRSNNASSVPQLSHTGSLRPIPSPLTGSRYFWTSAETAEMVRRLRLLTHVVSTESEPSIFEEHFNSDIERQSFIERGYLLFKDAYTEPPKFVPNWMTNPAAPIESPSNEPWASYIPARTMPTCFPLSKPAPEPKTMQIALSQVNPPLPGSTGIRYFETSWLGDDRIEHMTRFYEELCNHATLPLSKITSFIFSYGWSEKILHVSAEAAEDWPFNFAALPKDWDDWKVFKADVKEAARKGVKIWRMKVLVVAKEE